ncbi:hypothetical protein SLEP1_g37527 [Rubroshorea leprosula]|uniref:Uncharacterized protein n=1 Tax=Rubroshorea leprosula TaxID=152421 RepID=A0AAV5KVK3_9ROSI|nr:hypothetical protein SLEP1_g37527 [Rubroshorea leprosula]
MISLGPAHPCPYSIDILRARASSPTSCLSPMLTIAAGLILAHTHDYVLMRKYRGFLYISEMDIVLEIPLLSWL